jgi:Putative methyltransferase
MGALAFEAGLLIIQVLLFVAVAVFLFRVLVFAISGYLDVPFVPTSVHYADIVAATLDLSPGDVVFELGSGDGRFMLALAALQPGARFVGVEHNPLLHIAALTRRRFGGDPGNVEFQRGDFFATDFSPANKMYLYLLDPVMHQLQPKFDNQFKGRVVSRAFPFTRKKLSNVVALSDHIGMHGQHLLFVYDFD